MLNGDGVCNDSALQWWQRLQAVFPVCGSHQHGDLCGLGLRQRAFGPVVLRARSDEARVPTDVLGCLSLPSDVLAESRDLPELTPGDVLAVANAWAYCLGASPFAFQAHPAPAEVTFEGAGSTPCGRGHRRAPSSRARRAWVLRRAPCPGKRKTKERSQPLFAEQATRGRTSNLISMNPKRAGNLPCPC